MRSSRKTVKYNSLIRSRADLFNTLYIMSSDNNTNPQEEEVLQSSVLEDIEQTIDDQSQDIPHASWTGQWTQNTDIQKLQDALTRAQADYQNLLMRMDRDKADMVHFLSAKILLPLLTQVDNLERAVKLKAWVEGDGFIDGIRSVQSGLEKFLEVQWVIAFDSIGHEVDPDRHEVMTEMAGESGKIVQEFEKGYLLRDRVLRHAKVVVGNGE